MKQAIKSLLVAIKYALCPGGHFVARGRGGDMRIEKCMAESVRAVDVRRRRKQATPIEGLSILTMRFGNAHPQGSEAAKRIRNTHVSTDSEINAAILGVEIDIIDRAWSRR